MNINNVNQLFNEKLQSVNSRLPEKVNVNNKFQALLEEYQLKTTPNTPASEVPEKSTDAEINSLLKTLVSTQALSNSSSLFSNNSTLSTMNNTSNLLQQTQLLNMIKNNLTSNDKDEKK